MMHRRKRATIRRCLAAAVFPALVVTMIGCGSDQSGPGSQTAIVRLLQADPAAPQVVDLAIDDAVVARGVAFGRASPKVTTSAGPQRLAIKSGATAVAQSEADLRAGSTPYTVSSAGALDLAEAASDGGGMSPD